MGVGHLDNLYTEFPELFQLRDLPPGWDDDLIIVGIDDPDWSGGVSEPDGTVLGQAPDSLSYLDLENFGAAIASDLPGVAAYTPVVIDVLGGAHAGAPVSMDAGTRVPPPECLAFYLPFHYYYRDWWGIYLLFEGVLWLAQDIVRRSNSAVPWSAAVQASRLFLYYHEAFHHKTESFATRLEVTHRQPLFKTGFERFFQATVGKDDCLEEGLACAAGLVDTRKRTRHVTIDQALTGYVTDCPPGYRLGATIRRDLRAWRCQFAESNQQICLPHLPGKDDRVWQTALHMFDGIANIKSHVNYVIPRHSPLAARLPLRPLLPPNKLVKKLKELARLTFVRHGSRHDVYRTPFGKTVQIPRHPRDLGTGLVRRILREAGLDIGLEEFMQL